MTPCPAFEVADFCNYCTCCKTCHHTLKGVATFANSTLHFASLKWKSDDWTEIRFRLTHPQGPTCPERPRRHSLGNWSSSKVIKVEESIAGRPGPFNCSLKGDVTSTWMRFICFRQMELRFMWWRLVIDYRHKSFDSCRSQALEFRRVVMGWPINQLCVILFYCFEVCSGFHIHGNKKFYIFLRICFSLHQKEFPAITPPTHMQTLLSYWS